MLYSFVTEVLNKPEEEFWRMSLRRLFALITMHDQKAKRQEESKEQVQLNQALNQMRSV